MRSDHLHHVEFEELLGAAAIHGSGQNLMELFEAVNRRHSTTGAGAHRQDEGHGLNPFDPSSDQ